MPDLTSNTRPADVGAVLWMRHGTSHDGLHRPRAHARPDTALADVGRDQVLAAAIPLRAATPALVVSSPLPRARATAELLADALHAPLGPMLTDLAEWRAPDCVLGLAPDNYPPQYQRWRVLRAQQPETALPAGESLAAFTRRGDRVRCEIHQLAYETGGPLVVVSHRLLIGAVAALDTGILDPGAVFAAASAFTLAPAGVWRQR